jgi:hypothetical protein
MSWVKLATTESLFLLMVQEEEE